MTSPHLEPGWLASNPVVGFRFDIVKRNVERPWQQSPSMVAHVLRANHYTHEPVGYEPRASPFESRLIEGWETEHFIGETIERQVKAEAEWARETAERNAKASGSALFAYPVHEDPLGKDVEPVQVDHSESPTLPPPEPVNINDSVGVGDNVVLTGFTATDG